jgi:hypothetical protein
VRCTNSSYVYLRIIPFVHAQGLDLGDVRSQLAVQGCASHAQEDAQLQRWSVRAAFKVRSTSKRARCRVSKGRNSRSSSPILCSTVSIRRTACAALPLTWIPRAAIRACAVPRDRFDQVLQGTLITRLLAFVQGRRHRVWTEEWFGRRSKIGERQDGHEGKTRGEGA